MTKNGKPRWQRRHEGILLWMLKNPWAKLKDVAQATGYSPSQVSRIVGKSDFQGFYRELMDAELMRAARQFLDNKNI